jgi:hypothetical protein
MKKIGKIDFAKLQTFVHQLTSKKWKEDWRCGSNSKYLPSKHKAQTPGPPKKKKTWEDTGVLIQDYNPSQYVGGIKYVEVSRVLRPSQAQVAHICNPS